MEERIREFSTIESIDDLKGLVDLLNLPKYESKDKDFKPINFKNVAVEKAKIKYYPRDLTFRNAESFLVEKTVYVFGISSMRGNDYFDYVIFSENKKILEDSDFTFKTFTTLRNLLEYKTLEKLS